MGTLSAYDDSECLEYVMGYSMEHISGILRIGSMELVDLSAVIKITIRQSPNEPVVVEVDLDPNKSKLMFSSNTAKCFRPTGVKWTFRP